MYTVLQSARTLTVPLPPRKTQVCPAEFIGFIESQHHLHVEGEVVASHDELMANFFAQPDALALGNTREQLVAEGCPPELIPHRTFAGNRPSLSLLMPKVTARACVLFVCGQRSVVPALRLMVSAHAQTHAMVPQPADAQSERAHVYSVRGQQSVVPMCLVVSAHVQAHGASACSCPR